MSVVAKEGIERAIALAKASPHPQAELRRLLQGMMASWSPTVRRTRDVLSRLPGGDREAMAYDFPNWAIRRVREELGDVEPEEGST